MIRPRSTTPLQRLAGSGLRWTFGDRRVVPAVSSNLASTGWVVRQEQQQARPRSTAASVVPGQPHHNIITRDRWSASRGRAWGTGRQQRLHSCHFAGDAAKTSRAAAGGIGLAAGPRSSSDTAAGRQRSKTTQASSISGAETANGITFETGKVSLCTSISHLSCYRISKQQAGVFWFSHA